MIHHPDLSIEYEAMLRERDFGSLSRQPIKYLGTESNKQHISVEQLISNHNGEVISTFKARIVKAFDAVIKDAQEKKYQSILVVTHGGPLRVLTDYWLEDGFKPLEGLSVTSVAQGNTAITKVTLPDKQIIKFNSTTHLKNNSKNQPPPPAV